MAIPKGKNFYIGGLMYILIFGGAGAGVVDRDSDTKCRGDERWIIKIASDKDAEEIIRKPTSISLEELIQVNTDGIPKGDVRGEEEKITYTLKNVFITHAILENDNDIHLVIEDGRAHTIIAEIPDMSCKDNAKSLFAKEIAQARKTFIRYQNTYDQYLFNVTGVFFRDKPHGQTGKAPNNAELHPVIRLEKVRKINLTTRR
ncbi:MAG: hypothetical protein JSU09_16380 [Bacteroidetes bacterium]|nr:hypothetical protein [Bacteroidota bacterium]